MKKLTKDIDKLEPGETYIADIVGEHPAYHYVGNKQEALAKLCEGCAIWGTSQDSKKSIAVHFSVNAGNEMVEIFPITKDDKVLNKPLEIYGIHNINQIILH